jgi:hypothetical protein
MEAGRWSHSASDSPGPSRQWDVGMPLPTCTLATRGVVAAMPEGAPDLTTDAAAGRPVGQAGARRASTCARGPRDEAGPPTRRARRPAALGPTPALGLAERLSRLVLESQLQSRLGKAIWAESVGERQISPSIDSSDETRFSPRNSFLPLLFEDLMWCSSPQDLLMMLIFLLLSCRKFSALQTPRVHS